MFNKRNEKLLGKWFGGFNYKGFFSSAQIADFVFHMFTSIQG